MQNKKQIKAVTRKKVTAFLLALLSIAHSIDTSWTYSQTTYLSYLKTENIHNHFPENTSALKIPHTEYFNYTLQ
ncbi:hypothetical protein [Dialister micraerophilus]|uniref:Uncharacterized protein n=1 Tax=Dialister micraerophilus DSM 19965 TaxID=888062 RepID=F2BWM0_9FIRM|nr:hypothetical protein [Dialister micraerophilus]EGF14887.1 hypothetical protein HMPREF9083_0587 [Dialister micraerophilus DSM 19965]